MKIRKARQNKIINKDVFIFLQHNPVFIFVFIFLENNIKVSRDFLNKKKIPFINTNRGGKITYHGPGQLVVYIIADLKANNWKIIDFIKALEKVMLCILKSLGISAYCNTKNRGVWYKENKIGSLGIHMNKGITNHGFALNINTDTMPFEWINPCGLKDVSAISVKEITGEEFSMTEIYQIAKNKISKIFNIILEQKDEENLLKMILVP